MELILLAVLSLLIGAGAALFLKSNSPRIWFSLSSQAIAFVCVFMATLPVLLKGTDLRGLVEWSFPVNDINLKIDPLSALFLLFSIPMTLLGSLYARGYLKPYFEKKRHVGLHFALLNFVSLSFIFIYTVENSLAFILGWEIAAVSAWLLVIWDYHNQRIRFAGFNYLVSTHAGLLLLLTALLLLHSSTGSFDFKAFKIVLSESGPYRNVIFLLLVTSFALKSAFYPFHTWLPRAHSAAPAHISALMSGVIHKAGLYGLLRFTLLMDTPDEWMGWYLIGFSTLSAFMGALYTVTQRDLKRLLGYSSTENVGIAGIGIGLGYLGLAWQQPLLVAFGFSGAALHILNHALFKCLLFYVAGVIFRSCHTVDIEKLGGLIKKMPQTAVLFLIGSLGISAAPAFNGFISEFLIYNGLLRDWHIDAVHQSLLVLTAAILALIGGISFVSVARSFGISFLGEPRNQTIVGAADPVWSMRWPMLLHAAGILMLGCMPTLGLGLVRSVTQQFLRTLRPQFATTDFLGDIVATLGPIALMSTSLIAVTAGLFWGRHLLTANSPNPDVGTWACGYDALNPRMQYSGSSFSDPMIGVFARFLRALRREDLPTKLFPVRSHINTHFVDTVERRLFKVIGEGEAVIQSLSAKIQEGSQVSFALGLIAILFAMAFFLLKNGIL